MPTRHCTIATFLLCTLCVPFIAHGAYAQPLNRTIPNFQLKATDGRNVAFTEFRTKKAIAVIFIGTQCPMVNQYVLRLKAMHAKYTAKGVQILAINSNCHDTFANIVKHARQRKLPFPVLHDEQHKVADLFGAELTPEAFVLDNRGRVRYHGRIDDLFGVNGEYRSKPTRHDLKEALNDILAGRAVRVAQTKATGCYISRPPKAKAATTVTYTQHVARIIQKNCQECHRPGQVAPFSLMTYDDARSWSRTIARVVKRGQMPPWNADSRHGEFANDRSLSDTDKQLLLDWIKQGCPKGDAKYLPPAKKYTKEWRIGQPDVVLHMDKAFRVPASPGKGGIAYQYFTLKTNFKEDVWIQRAEAKPGKHAVVHHMTVYVGDAKNNRVIESGDWRILGGYVPGNRPTMFPDELGIKIPKGKSIMLEMHYTANGTEQFDKSSVGLVFSKKKPKREVRIHVIVNKKFTIPPHADNHKVTASTTVNKEIMLMSLYPHMHLRGKAFQFRVVYPDSKSKILLSVPRYDFNWQHTYVLKKPLRLPAGTKIECTGWFDNSATNPHNPNPNRAVGWGEQTWDEMMLGSYSYYYTKDN